MRDNLLKRALLAGSVLLLASGALGALPPPMDGRGSGTVIESGWAMGEHSTIEVDYMHVVAGPFRAVWRAEVPATADREEFSPSLAYGLGAVPGWSVGRMTLDLPLWAAFGLAVTPYVDEPWGGAFVSAGIAPGVGSRHGRLGVRAALRLPLYRMEDGAGSGLLDGPAAAAQRTEIDLRLTFHGPSERRLRWAVWGGGFRPAGWSPAAAADGSAWSPRGGVSVAVGF